MNCSFTVLGAGGYIGRHLVASLRAQAFDVWAPAREDEDVLVRPLGNAVYAIGVTGDFRRRPFDTVEAHVTKLARLVREAHFDSLVVLSSTRVYGGASSTHEDTSLSVNPQDPSDLYNLSKLMGESVALCSGREGVRVARLSNVIGPGMDPDTLIGALLRAARAGAITLDTNPDSAKDYIHIDDVVRLLRDIALHGRSRVYNVATGTQVTHAEWLRALARTTGCSVQTSAGAPSQSFHPIDVSRVRAEFGFTPRGVLDAVPDMLQAL